ncbi:MAG TPA: condensation domain-containing protein, partial [Thermoanaerobaculia bacterium]|nr:condensation domain-containing protein [Thermoanaerobaculia bacterium]
GDSILSMQIVSRANQEGLRLTPRQMFQHQTIAELSAVAGAAEAVRAEQGTVTGTVPLTPIQRWFFERELPDPDHYNLAVFLAVAEPLDPARLELTVQRLALQHDALRLRFRREESGWMQLLPDSAGPVPYALLDLSALPERLHRRAVEEAATSAQRSLDLARGPIFRVVSFDLGPGRAGRLLFVVHHLAVDGVSWRILLEDLETVYRQLGRGEAPRLPAKTTSFRSWARRLASHAFSPDVDREAVFWLARAGEATEPLPADFPGAGNGGEGSVRRVSLELGEEATRALLQEVPEVYGTRINDVLLAALGEAFSRWTSRRLLRLDLESHGREDLFEDVDLSRTVGWFTAELPVLLNLEGVRGPGEALVAVKEQLRRIPAGGLGYGLLRYLRPGEEVAERLRALPRPQVLFNYLGQLGDGRDGKGSLFTRAPEDGGPTVDPRGTRSHLLQIDCSVADGRLRAEWAYSADRHRRETVEGLARGFFAAIETLIEHCRMPGAGAYTPSDFPDADLGDDDFASLMDRLSRAE